MFYSAVAILMNIKKTVNETDYFPKHLQEAVFTVAKMFTIISCAFCFNRDIHIRHNKAERCFLKIIL